MWLEEYYEVLSAAIKKSNAYTDSEIAKVRTKFTVVASYSDLPDPGRTDTIYLVPKTGMTNIYDQYIYENGSYVDIGDTTIDLSDYVNDSEFQQAIQQKVDKVPNKGLSTNDYTTAEKNKLAGIETGAEKNVTPDTDLDETSINPVENRVIAKNISKLQDNLSKLINNTAPKFGVQGIGGSVSSLTRLGDAVGLTAQVGTNGDNSSVINSFDNFAPWMRKKCVGEWSINSETNRPEFTVNAYLGDANFAEDGSMGDYVAVECPLCYYKLKDDELWISEFKIDSDYHPFDVFCINHDENNLLNKIYIPAYALALDDNDNTVCLPGYDNEQGNYAGLYNKARAYKGGSLGKDGSLGTYANLQPMALNFYEWALFTVEFATQNCQSIMQGCSILRSDNNDKCTFIDANNVLLNNYSVSRVVGEYVCISTASNHYDVRYKATHKIVSITRCNSTGVPDASGTYSLIELLDLGKNYFFNYDLTGQTEYQFAARPYRTGECNNVSTSSGSPVSNSNGYYPMKYRHRENVYGNQYKTVCDLFNILVKDASQNDMLEWYYLPDPTDLESPITNIPDSVAGQNILKSDPYVKLSVVTPNVKYVNGYVKSKEYDTVYKNLGIPSDMTGSSTTFFSDYAFLVSSSVVRSVRVSGYWYSASLVGFSSVNGYYTPSTGSAHYGGDLYIIQNAG